MIVYDSWNDMLNARDEIHQTYIRSYNHGTRWEVVHYSRWNAEIYVAYCGSNASSLEELIEKLQKQGYDVTEMDICTYKEEER